MWPNNIADRFSIISDHPDPLLNAMEEQKAEARLRRLLRRALTGPCYSPLFLACFRGAWYFRRRRMPIGLPTPMKCPRPWNSRRQCILWDFSCFAIYLRSPEPTDISPGACVIYRPEAWIT
jgi:hypothetical protein